MVFECQTGWSNQETNCRYAEETRVLGPGPLNIQRNRMWWETSQAKWDGMTHEEEKTLKNVEHSKSSGGKRFSEEVTRTQICWMLLIRAENWFKDLATGKIPETWTRSLWNGQKWTNPDCRGFRREYEERKWSQQVWLVFWGIFL